ncbi:MAG: magnesium transporter [Synechococcus sp.]
MPGRGEDSRRSEIRQMVREQLKLLLADGNFNGAKSLLQPVQSVDVAEAIDGLPKPMQLGAFRLLGKQAAIEVYEYLPLLTQQALIEQFRDLEILNVVDRMSPDDRARLFDELPPRLARKAIAGLSTEERQRTALLLGYGPETAGRLMTPEYLALPDLLTVEQIASRVRAYAAESEVSYYVYLLDEQRRLSGVVSLRTLLLAEPEARITDVMDRDVVFANTDTDREEVAMLIQRYDLIALPVTDGDRSLVGVVTVDDAIDVLQAETTEDIYTMGAVQSEGESYFQAKLSAVARKRLPWLFILLFTNVLTIWVMQNFEDVLDEVVALAFFTPLLIDAGGNVGAQSSTVVIRGLSTNELAHRNPLVVVVRECIAGSVLGLLLGLAVIVLVVLFVGQLEIGLTVGISLLCIASIAATTGAGLPFLFANLGFDPALMASPFITTVVDILGIVIYLSVAKTLLGL